MKKYGLITLIKKQTEFTKSHLCSIQNTVSVAAPDSGPDFAQLYRDFRSGIAVATCMQPQWTQAKGFLEDVRTKAKHCVDVDQTLPCYFEIITSIKTICRYWGSIEKQAECSSFTALRMKTVSWFNRNQPLLIDALVSFPAPALDVNSANWFKP